VTAIIFRRRAFEEMDRIIQTHPARTAEFATALRELTICLTSNAEGMVESREPPYRVIVCGQLTFGFRPAPDEGRVYVVWVHLREVRR
jgi:hypothetical protein